MTSSNTRPWIWFVNVCWAESLRSSKSMVRISEARRLGLIARKIAVIASQKLEVFMRFRLVEVLALPQGS